MLKGHKINLRLMKESDLADFLRLTHDLEVLGPHFPVGVEAEPVIRKRFLENGMWTDECRLMLIVDSETNRMLGFIAAFPIHRYRDVLELGYILHEVSRRGEGIMTEAVKLFCGYLFRLKNIFRIQILTDGANIASCKTAERAGFKHEATLRQFLVGEGQPRDVELYSILRSEYAPLPKQPGRTGN